MVSFPKQDISVGEQGIITNLASTTAINGAVPGNLD